jgi:hypothetical protein
MPKDISEEMKLAEILEASLVRRIKERRQQLLPGLFAKPIPTRASPRRRRIGTAKSPT